MKSLWRDEDVVQYQNDLLALRVYTSRLLGQESDLVLHGGGNTSVKLNSTNIFGETENILYVKGSGWDLATIEAAGFAPVKLDVLKKMVQLAQLSDFEMVRLQRAAMTDPQAPNPSVEAILHAIIPYAFVDHTHADAVITITNTLDGEARIREIYGSRVLVVPYVMPGFILAKKIAEMTRELDWGSLEGMILMNHGVFSFGEDAKTSYERMIQLVTMAEDYLRSQGATLASPTLSDAAPVNLTTLSQIRQQVAMVKGGAILAQLDTSPTAVHFANLPEVASIATRGPLTPDHVIRTKQKPLIINENNQNVESSITQFTQAYHDYFARYSNEQLTALNPAPCWAVWCGVGLISFGRSVKEAQIISDIKDHTVAAIERAEKLGGWQALPEQDIFDMEYWELEQAKLKTSKSSPPLQGKIALVTGAASGIGRACVEMLHAQGAAVIALDISPQITNLFSQPAILGLVCDITHDEAIKTALETGIGHFGGLDILISNAGSFPPSEKIAAMNPKTWDDSIALNLTSHQRILTACLPYLKLGIEPAVVMIASKNVPAPGPGVAAYSVAKAGQTQLARVAALELAPLGIRVNMLHPNAVFDTGIWTTEILEKRAQHYGLTVEEYKTNNLLKTEVTSKDVAALACAMAGTLFAKTTGAQVPIDGGNERVI
jgi:rhamnose utilization protein RhaD (predicted bifunctional aldolase and dehydrogenase)/NAD(P)-dependent dehydrogenase (short-subunit alcohol dehydrogenase family)